MSDEIVFISWQQEVRKVGWYFLLKIEIYRVENNPFTVCRVN